MEHAASARDQVAQKMKEHAEKQAEKQQRMTEEDQKGQRGSEPVEDQWDHIDEDQESDNSMEEETKSPVEPGKPKRTSKIKKGVQSAIKYVKKRKNKQGTETLEQEQPVVLMEPENAQTSILRIILLLAQTQFRDATSS